MGMHFVIKLDKKVECEDSFPNGLSWFFERSGAFMETSEYKQISLLLDIDLNIFDTSTHPYTEYGEPQGLVLKVDFFKSKVNEFINKLELNPNIDRKIIYDAKFKNEEEQRNLMDIQFENMQKKLMGLELMDLTNSDLDYSTTHPIRNDYISSGQLKNDLIELLSIITCYEKCGVKNATLIYL
jgi:hypothetical protein